MANPTVAEKVIVGMRPTADLGRPRLRILYVTHHFPHERAFGGQLRTLQMARLLSRYGELSVVVVPLEGQMEAEAIRKTRADFRLAEILQFSPWKISGFRDRLRHEFDPFYLNTYGKGLNAEGANRLKALAGEHDVVWFRGAVIPNGAGIARCPGSVLDVDDVTSRFCRSAIASESTLWQKMLMWRRVWLWKRREKVLLDRFDVLATCSEADRQYLGGGDRIVVIPNGFEAPKSIPHRSPVSPARIGFIGLLRYGPNREGLTWFSERVWPLIKSKYPDVRLRLVGSGTDFEVQNLGPDIDGLGWIEDPAAEIATWALMIVPVRSGGGTRIKIAEGFSRNCPVVSTSLGAFGYELESGKEIVLADKPDAFANACCSILEDPEMGVSLAKRAWTKLQQNWTWDAIAPRVAVAVERCWQIRRAAQ